MKFLRSICSGALAFLVAAALTACGGTGGAGGPGAGNVGGGTTVDPPAALMLAAGAYSIKSLHFSWAPVDSLVTYKLLESIKGDGNYTVVADNLPANSTEYTFQAFLPPRVNARYILQACNSGGCTDSQPVALLLPLNGAIGYVKASNTRTNDEFGTSVALSADGNTLAVGTPLEDDSASGINQANNDSVAPSSGAVYVYARDGLSWVQQAYVKAGKSEAGDQFGNSVALSADGHVLVVGAPGESSSRPGINQPDTEAGQPNSGAVYVFARSSGGWTQQAFIKAFNGDANHFFGSSVAVSADGSTVATGAPGESSNFTGVFTISVAPAGNVGAPSSGAVYTYRSIDAVWSTGLYIKASNTGANDRFGTHLALSGDGQTLAVGAPGEASSAQGLNGAQGDNAAPNSGAAYVFTHVDAVSPVDPDMQQTAYVKPSATTAGDAFGTVVALSHDGATLAVSAPQEDAGGDASGAAYVFARGAGNSWSQGAYLKAFNPGPQDLFGISLALSPDGNTLAVGALLEDGDAIGLTDPPVDNDNASGSGAAYVFARGNTGWAQQAYVKASNASAGSRFGRSLALAQNSDGMPTLAVGATGDSSGATGVGGDQSRTDALTSGAVYLY
ncbi:MAG: integrin [Hydrogenophaga sp.]|uniref:integrin n=1 Tax=Hydrogenophaga sp. TaxID=1904254 RepID=UPI00257D784A|nr:integrin [Hydrogenophaga sp.]MBL0943724.1 integrin [Hydrogenophaga sp.]